MHNALYPIIKEMSSGISSFNGASHEYAQEVRTIIQRKVRKAGLRKVIPYREIAEAAIVVLSRIQQAPCNMGVVISDRCYYSEGETKFFKEER